MNPSRPTWLLFDLGGVLMDFAGPRDLPPLLTGVLAQATPDELKLKMAHCAATDGFERGTLSPEAFAEQFVREWQVALAPAEFLQRYVAWLRGLYPGADTLLAQLRAEGFRLACLSNTNAAHWERNEAMRWLQRTLDVAIGSHQLGLRKPEPAIFATALARLQAAPDQVGYFDDLHANVAAARAAGLQAHHVDGLADLRARLRSLGWLA